jgi:hypothetical protein
MTRIARITWDRDEWIGAGPDLFSARIREIRVIPGVIREIRVPSRRSRLSRRPRGSPANGRASEAGWLQNRMPSANWNVRGSVYAAAPTGWPNSSP